MAITKKKLIINPSSEEQAGIVMLNPGPLLEEIVTKVLQKGPKDRFDPFYVSAAQVTRFLSNVENKTIGAQKYAGVEIKSYDEALKFFSETASDVYGPGWMAKVISNEIHLSSGPSKVFGVMVPSSENIEVLKKEISIFADVQIGEQAAPDTSKKKTKKQSV